MDGTRVAMNPAVVFARTDKGRDEIATRRHQLSPKLRAALFLVDGQKPLSRLMVAHRGNMDLASLLERLEADGFVERLRSTRPERKAPRVASGVAAVDRGLPAPEPEPVDPVPLARDVAVRLLQEVMGRDAEHLATRFERCATGEQLLAQAERFAIMIGAMRDKSAGEDYLRQVRAALTGA